MPFIKSVDGEEEGYIRTQRRQYLPFITYQAMGGTLDEATFISFEYEAETIVNLYTYNRLKEEEVYPDELEYCMFRLIQLAQLEADALMLGKLEGASNSDNHRYIRGQSNDGVSIDYNCIDASKLYSMFISRGKDNPMAQVVFRYLNGVRNSKGYRLTYKGLYPDE